jgi:hypothetical protein
VAVDERQAQRERLRETDERVVDRGVAVRVQLAHHVADDARALDVPAVGPQPHLRHLEQDPPLHGESVAGVGRARE